MARPSAQVARPAAPAVRGGKRGAAAATTLAAAVVLMLTGVFEREGGYVNHPNDPGGATNHGVTEAVARKHGYRGHMRDLPRWCPLALNKMIDDAEHGRPVRLVQPCADTILFYDYFYKPGIVLLVQVDIPVADELKDSNTNFGPARPAGWFQRALNENCGTTLTVDRRIGPITTAAWAQCRARLGPPVCVKMLDSLDRQQEAEYDRLVRRNPRLAVFRRGWQNLRIGNVDRARCWSNT